MVRRPDLRSPVGNPVRPASLPQSDQQGACNQRPGVRVRRVMAAPQARSRGAGAALLAAALAAAVGVGWRGATQQDTGAAVEYDTGTRRLSFSLPQFAGGALTTDALRGRPVVLNFYASWCAVCREEMPEFERFAQEVSDRVAVIGVNPQSNDDDAAQADLVARTGVTYPTVRDRADALLRVFDPSGALPTTVFLDAGGRVVRVVNGQLTEGQLTRIVAADFGVQVQHTLGDRAEPRTGPPPARRPARR